MDETIVQKIFLYPHDLMISSFTNPHEDKYIYGICIAGGPKRDGKKITIIKNCSTTQREAAELLYALLKNVKRLGDNQYSNGQPILTFEIIDWISDNIKKYGVANTWDFS